MTSREKFEKQFTFRTGRDPRGYYLSVATEMQWKAWQAAYAAGQESMRERAAQAVEEAPCDCCWPDGSEPISEELAVCVRALEIEK